MGDVLKFRPRGSVPEKPENKPEQDNSEENDNRPKIKVGINVNYVDKENNNLGQSFVEAGTTRMPEIAVAFAEALPYFIQLRQYLDKLSPVLTPAAGDIALRNTIKDYSNEDLMSYVKDWSEVKVRSKAKFYTFVVEECLRRFTQPNIFPDKF